MRHLLPAGDVCGTRRPTAAHGSQGDIKLRRAKPAAASHVDVRE